VVKTLVGQREEKREAESGGDPAVRVYAWGKANEGGGVKDVALAA